MRDPSLDWKVGFREQEAVVTGWMPPMSRPGQAGAVCTSIALSIAIAAVEAQATVRITEPSAYTISTSEIICVARVDQVLGARPFTNRNPPDVLVTVQDGIKGTRRGETLRLLDWVTGGPGWSEVSGRPTADQISRWESKPAAPPALGVRLLLFLKRSGPHQAELFRTIEGPVLVPSPDVRTIETVRGAAWLAFTVRPIRELTPPPVTIVGTIANHSADSMWFDLRHARVTYATMPTGLAPGERWRPHYPPPIRLGPGESRECSFRVETISQVPIGLPGHYWFGLELPANVNGQGTFIPVHFRIDGERKLQDAAAASWVVFVATVDSILLPARHGARTRVGLIDHRFLLGDIKSSPPGNVFFVDWRRDLPLRPRRGRRYIMFLNREWAVWHVTEMNGDNLELVQAGLTRAGQ